MSRKKELSVEYKINELRERFLREKLVPEKPKPDLIVGCPCGSNYGKIVRSEFRRNLSNLFYIKCNECQKEHQVNIEIELYGLPLIINRVHELTCEECDGIQGPKILSPAGHLIYKNWIKLDYDCETCDSTPYIIIKPDKDGRGIMKIDYIDFVLREK